VALAYVGNNEGFPLDRISVHIECGKYYHDMDDQAKKLAEGDDGFSAFFQRVVLSVNNYPLSDIMIFSIDAGDYSHYCQVLRFGRYGFLMVKKACSSSGIAYKTSCHILSRRNRLSPNSGETVFSVVVQ
jgi:hypothetical protein